MKMRKILINSSINSSNKNKIKYINFKFWCFDTFYSIINKPKIYLVILLEKFNFPAVVVEKLKKFFKIEYEIIHSQKYVYDELVFKYYQIERYYIVNNVEKYFWFKKEIKTFANTSNRKIFTK